MQTWELLMRHTRAMMMKHAEAYGERMPQSWKKERMARRLEQLMEAQPGRTQMLLPEDTVRYMCDLLRKYPDGVLPMTCFVEEETEDPDESFSALYLLKHVVACDRCGLVYIETRDGREVCAMTDVAQSVFRPGVGPDAGQLRYMESAFRCAVGIMNTYGALEVEELKALLCRCFPGGDPELLRWLVDYRLELFSGEINVMEDEGDGTRLYTLLSDMDEFSQLMAQMEASAKIMPRRLYTRKQYEFAAEHGWPCYPDHYDDVRRLLMKQDVDMDMATAILDDALTIHQEQIEPDDDAIDALASAFDGMSERDVQRFIRYMTDLFNTASMWVLLGNSPEEAAQARNRKQGRVVPFPGRR